MKRQVLMEKAKISKDEITYSNRVDPTLLKVMAFIREEVDSPINYNSSGISPEDVRHSTMSLHRVGINHALSKREGRIRLNRWANYKAFDVTCPDLDLIDFYWVASRFIPGGGIGIYPYWNTPGLHLDVRGMDHPGYGSRWWRDEKGGYHNIHNNDQLIDLGEMSAAIPHESITTRG